MSQFQILGRRPFPFKAIPIRFAYTNFPDTISNELTRAEFVTVFHRIVDPEAAGVDFTTVKNETGFADVEDGN